MSEPGSEPGKSYPTLDLQFGMTSDYPHCHDGSKLEFFGTPEEAAGRAEFLAKEENRAYVLLKVIGRVRLSKQVTVDMEKQP